MRIVQGFLDQSSINLKFLNLILNPVFFVALFAEFLERGRILPWLEIWSSAILNLLQFNYNLPCQALIMALIDDLNMHEIYLEIAGTFAFTPVIDFDLLITI